MVDRDFFDEITELSEVKVSIVSKYFDAWANVIEKHTETLAYVDLFAGPGRYGDGSKSTPLHVLEKAIGNSKLRGKLVAVFNDKNPAFVSSLKREVDQLPGIRDLTHSPSIHNFEVGDDIAKLLEEMGKIPTLLFIDPWGYKGLSLRLICSVLGDWACESIFFFNYNRINMCLGKGADDENMLCLFGKERLPKLVQRLCELEGPEREWAIIEELSEALKELGWKFILPFRFKDSRGVRTSHHLIHVSKDFLGYHIMKGIMARESTVAEQGVSSFEYNQASKKFPLLFELNRPLDDLEMMLVENFAGRTITVKDLYEQHSVGRPYVKKNYREVLKKLEADEKIIVSRLYKKRRQGTFPDDVFVNFSERD